MSIDTLRVICDNLPVGLTRNASEAEMTASIRKASGATAKVQKTNLDALAVETIKHICVERKLNVEIKNNKTALIVWIQNSASSIKKGARKDENKIEQGISSERIQQPPKAKARRKETTKTGKESACMALAAEDKPKNFRVVTTYNLFMKNARLKNVNLSLEQGARRRNVAVHHSSYFCTSLICKK